jgi:hypothetical protein
MNFGELTPFVEAVKAHDARAVLPTSADTRTIRQLDAAVRRQSLFSAQTLYEDLLNGYKDKVESLLNPTTERRDDRVTADNPEGNVTTGYDLATARLEQKQLLRSLGYQPGEGERGTLRDLSSDARVNLVLKTNQQMMQGAGHFIQANDEDVLDAFPCQELVRFEGRKVERNWEERFRLAAERAGDTDAIRVLEETGRMIARKDSPLWDELGSSDLFPDGLDNPYPPFAFGSGMGLQDVDFETSEKLGLVTLDNIPKTQELDIESLFGEAA